MILLKISSENEQAVKAIAALLLREQLAVDISFNNTEQRLQLRESKLESHPMYSIKAKTKALLFSTIEQRIKNISTDILPEIYSLPITTMEISQAEQVIQQTQKV
jgi:uncharacterized protein involved in tolerance to divalent cations